ncbi:MAG: hypothetical protein H7Y13_15955 [Sphingobacteriaceae bacterium]|nr:hypothetical protein [Sphingobacteriaceae bacterium]
MLFSLLLVTCLISCKEETNYRLKIYYQSIGDKNETSRFEEEKSFFAQNDSLAENTSFLWFIADSAAKNGEGMLSLPLKYEVINKDDQVISEHIRSNKHNN